MTSYSPIVAAMLKACNKASGHLARDFAEVEKLQVSRKGAGSFVTHADIKTEEILVTELQRARPDYGFLLEESGEIGPAEDSGPVRYRWIVDPIDGTVNFMHANPHFCISIALEKFTEQRSVSDKHVSDDQNVKLRTQLSLETEPSEIIAGLLCCPALRKYYWAEKGKGAYHINHLGQQSRLRVSARSNFPAAICAINSAVQFNAASTKNILDRVQGNDGRIRISGAVALDLAYVASGRFDIALHSNIKPWDIAAGALLVREAGGIIRNVSGGSIFDEGATIISGNAQLCRKSLVI